MPTTLSRALALAVPLTFGAALAGGQEPEARTLTVVGFGEVQAAPDTAVLQLAVETAAADAEQTTADNAAQTARVMAAIREKLGDDDELSTEHYSLSPHYASRRPGSEAPPEIVGYVARNQVRVEIHDLTAVGEILDQAVAAGANRGSGLRFVLQDRSPHLERAYQRAGREARAQAQAIAAALGVDLGEILRASTTSAQPIVPRPVEAMRLAAADSTPIDPGDIRVTATLTVTYRIE